MLIKVIYSDGSTGLLRTSRLAKLVKRNRIAAYQSFEGWVEVRRKHSNPNFQGPERRKQRPPQANSL
jgi:hypothetical protein